ncbi:MAG: DinB family protein [Thermomicrobiales bacterium]
MSEQSLPTIEELRAACDTNYAMVRSALDRLENPLSDEKDEGGWSVKQLLSHLIGAMYRVPIHSSYYFTSGDGNAIPDIPVEAHNDYWIKEWDTATTATYLSALDLAYQGNLAFLSKLDPTDLARPGKTIFGEWPLGMLIQISYAGHPLHFHGDQLEAFVAKK